MAVNNSLLPSRYKILYPTLHGTLSCSCECAETLPVSWLLTVSENWQHSLSPPSQRYHNTEPAAAETPTTITTPNLSFAFVACSLQRSESEVWLCWTWFASELLACLRICALVACFFQPLDWREVWANRKRIFERFKFLLVRPTRRRISNKVLCSVL